MIPYNIIISAQIVWRRQHLVLNFWYFFLFFRRQGFRMIMFDHQARPLQNCNRSQVMVIWRRFFPTPHPPPQKKICVCVLGLQEHFIAKK